MTSTAPKSETPIAQGAITDRNDGNRQPPTSGASDIVPKVTANGSRSSKSRKKKTAAPVASVAEQQLLLPPSSDSTQPAHRQDAPPPTRKKMKPKKKKSEGDEGSNSADKPSRPNQTPSFPCDCGKKFKNPGALRAHRAAAKAHAPHAPFRDGPAMVLMRALAEAPLALAEGAQLNGVAVAAAHVGANGVLEEGEKDEKVDVHLCECGRGFDTWGEVYKHLPGSSVHKPGSQVVVYSGKALRPRMEEREEQRPSEETSSSLSSQQAKSVEAAVADVRAKVDGSGPSKRIQCSCGKTLKNTNALRDHQRQSPKHRYPPKTAASGQDDPRSKPKQTTATVSTVTFIPALSDHTAEANAVPSPSASSAKKEKRSKPKNRSQRDRQGRSGGGGYGGGSFSGYGYTAGIGGMGGFGSSYASGFGGGYDWGLCDKDCGWCGHCMDGVDV